MQHPSKRVRNIARAEEKRLAAFHANDHEAFKHAVHEIARLEATADEYTCVCCGEHFPDGPHADLLVAAILIFGEDGTVTESTDYGIQEASQGRAGRRFKICGNCLNDWTHHPLAYAELE